LPNCTAHFANCADSQTVHTNIINVKAEEVIATHLDAHHI